jgi:SH3-like domain-containing protein
MFKPIISLAVLSSFVSVPVLAQSAAYIFAPPSNIRNVPEGEIICTINNRVTINVYERSGQWYYTDYCGGGYIHQSQIRFQGANPNQSPTSRARVVGLKQGQLALRDYPNGNSLAGLNNGNVVEILEQQANWAYVRVISGPNAQINGREGWVNSYYLALF